MIVRKLFALFVAQILAGGLCAQPLVVMETVVIGDADNTSDMSGYGRVVNEYRLGKYEVTIGQYTAFLNAVAKIDPYGLYNQKMAEDLNIAGIGRAGVLGSYIYSAIGPSGAAPVGANSPSNRPITYVSWFDAARFCNWLHNGASAGASTETGAYTLNGATDGIISRNPDARCWIPSINEWYKAAYYKGGGASSGYWLYPMQTDTPPGNLLGGVSGAGNYHTVTLSVTQDMAIVPQQNYLTDVGAFLGSSGAYGTFDQGGNVYEWVDVGGQGRVAGGSWKSGSNYLFSPAVGLPVDTVSSDPENNLVGFRVAALSVLPPSFSPIGPSNVAVTVSSSVTARRSFHTLNLAATANGGVSSVQYRLKAPGSKKFAAWTTRGVARGEGDAWSVKMRLPKRGKWQVQIQAFDVSGNSSAVRTVTVRRR